MSWLQRCRSHIGDVKRKMFGTLLEALVNSVLLYGAEMWECSRHLGAIEQVQLQVMRIFLGVGRLHPKTSLQMEMGMLSNEWQARIRCMVFFCKILNMNDSRRTMKTIK